MDDVVNIDFLLSDPENLDRVMASIANETERAAGATDDLGRRVEKVSGLYSRFDRAMRQLHQGIARGASGSEMLDMQSNARRAQESVNRYEAKPYYNPASNTVGQKFMQALLSSRFSIPGMGGGGGGGGGIGIQPLVGKSLRALASISPELAGIVAIGLASLEAAKMIKELADHASEASQKLQQEAISGGATNQEAALAASMGLNSGTANAVRSRALSDPFAYAAAQRLSGGQGYVAGPFGAMQDTTKQLLNIVHNLRGLDETSQRYYMRILGLEGFGGLLKVSDRTLDQLQADSELTAQVYDKQLEYMSAEYEASKSRIATSFSNFGGELGADVMPTVTDALNEFADDLNHITSDLHKYRGALQWLVELTLNPAGAVKRFADEAPGYNLMTSGANEKTVMDQHTSAMKDHTEALNRAVKNNVQGDRANRAIPKGYYNVGGNYVHQMAVSGSFPTGTL